MATKHPRIEVWPAAKRDQWYWHLVARNGRIVLTGGEGFTSKAHALRAVRSIIKAVANADVVVLP